MENTNREVGIMKENEADFGAEQYTNGSGKLTGASLAHLNGVKNQ